jgi:hypothetical protein
MYKTIKWGFTQPHTAYRSISHVDWYSLAEKKGPLIKEKEKTHLKWLLVIYTHTKQGIIFAMARYHVGLPY